MFKNVYVLATLVLLISSILSSVHIPEAWKWPNYIEPWVHKIAESGIVAAFLMLTIEILFRKSQMEAAQKIIGQINENVFQAVYKRAIPLSVVEEIEKSVFKKDVFRMGHELCYTLSKVPAELDNEIDCIDHVYCQMESKYNLENISGKEITHKIKVFIEKPVDAKWHEYCHLISLKVNDEEVDYDTESTPEQLIITHDVVIPEGGSISVTSDAKQIKRIVDMEVWTSVLPSDGMRLQVITAGTDLNAFAVANHRKKLVPSFANNRSISSWELKASILPYQSVAFWWKPEEPCFDHNDSGTVNDL